MNDIVTGEYANPSQVGYIGWIEPKSKEWILFIDIDGNPEFFPNRDSETGAVQ